MLTANLAYVVGDKERIAKAELGGGALLDLGVYTLNFTSMVFGDDIEKITGSAVLNEDKLPYCKLTFFIYASPGNVTPHWLRSSSIHLSILRLSSGFD